MTPDHFHSFFEEAFDKIEPRDEAHRERLAKMREKFKEIAATASAEIQEARDEAKRMREEGRIDVEEIRKRNSPVQEMWDGLLSSCDEQALLLERIVKATEARRSSR